MSKLVMAVIGLSLGGCTLTSSLDGMSAGTLPEPSTERAVTSPPSPTPSKELVPTPTGEPPLLPSADRPAKPLRLSLSADATVVSADGIFQAAFTKTRLFQLDTLNDLRVSSVDSVGGTEGVLVPVKWSQGCDGASDYCELLNAYDGTVAVLESSPAVVRLATSYRNEQWSQTPEQGTKTFVTYAIYPNGRMAVTVHIDDIGDFVPWFVFGILQPAAGFSAAPAMPERSFGFSAASGTAIVAYQSDADVKPAPWTTTSTLRAAFEIGSAYNRDNPPATAFDRSFELVAAHDDTPLPRRVVDGRAVAVRDVTGAEGVGAGYDRSLGAYHFRASGDPDLSLRVAPSVNGISIVIDDFTAAAWRVERDGQVLATSDVPLANGIVASYAPDAHRLTIVLTEPSDLDVALRIRALR